LSKVLTISLRKKEKKKPKIKTLAQLTEELDQIKFEEWTVTLEENLKLLSHTGRDSCDSL
jgi:hypothetical protein